MADLACFDGNAPLAGGTNSHATFATNLDGKLAVKQDEVRERPVEGLAHFWNIG
jgi:hypothetical protein